MGGSRGARGSMGAMLTTATGHGVLCLVSIEMLLLFEEVDCSSLKYVSVC
jgi:hypothetical protein